MNHVPKKYCVTLVLLLAGCSGEGLPLLDQGSSSSEGFAASDATSDATSDRTPADGRQPPLRDDAVAPWTWHDQVAVLINRTALSTAFAAAGYKPPSGTQLLAAHVLPGLSQPAFVYYSLGDSGLAFSQGIYWPASTVKLTAAVGALRTLGGLGLSGAAQLSFADDDGAYSGTAINLYSLAIEVSDNVAYNRLMEIAGFDETNDKYLVAAESLPKMVLQRRYTHPLPTSDLRHSPLISYVEGGKVGKIAARVGTGQHPECPNEGNCVTLLELVEVLRRVALHTEVPAADRFPLAAADVTGLQASLLASPTSFEPGASQALGHPLKVYNKTGSVPGNDRLDHGLIVDTVNGDRFLLAASMPYDTTSSAQMSDLAKHTLQAIFGQPAGSLALQRTAGIPIVVQLDDLGATSGGRKVNLTVSAAGASDLELFVDGVPLEKPQGPNPYFALASVFSKSGDRLLVVRARAAGALTGYRALTIHIP